MLYLDKWIQNQLRGIEEYQLSRLKEIVDYVSKKSVYYRNLADYKINNLDDLSRLPFAYPNDLKEEPYKLLCVPLGEIKRTFTLYTAGTTGIPKKVFFTQGDFDRISECMGVISKTVAECASLPEGYTVVQLLSNGKPESQAKLSSQGAKKVKAVPITVNPALDPESIIKVIKEHKPDILFGTPSKIYRITQKCVEKHNLGKISVKVLFLSSEYASEAMEKRLRDIWGCEVYRYFGMTEMGFIGGSDCQSHNGFHLNEMDFLLEVVNTETGKVVKEGVGEFVFTTLRREAMPLIRYRTGDLVELLPGRCPCGTSLKTIGRKIKRAEGIGKLGDNEVSLITFDDVLYTVPEVIDYQVALTKEGGKDRIAIKAEVTHKEGVTGKISKAIMSIPAVRENLEAGLLSEPKVEIVDSIKREGRAKKRLEHS